MEREKRAAALPKADKFAALRLAREGGSRAKQWKETQDEDLYDEVDEDSYKSIVRGRLQRDDFIEDDDGGGYADNGMDIFDDEDKYAVDDDSEEDRRNKKKKSAKTSKPAKPMPKKPAPVPKESTSAAYRKPVPLEKEDDFMSSLLSGMAAAKPAPVKSRQARPAPRKRKSSPVMGSSSDGESSHLLPGPSVPRKNGKTRPAPLDRLDDSDQVHSSPLRPPKRLKVDPELDSQVSRLKVEDPADDFAMDDFSAADFAAMDDIDIDIDMKPVAKPAASTVPVKAEEPSWLALHSALKSAPVEPEEVLTTSSGGSTGAQVNALQDDGSLHMYWIDYFDHAGKIYLFGKVLDRGPTGKGKSFVSCCLTVDGLERNLFVVPRDKVFEHGHYTDETPSRQDVFNDFNAMRKQMKIPSVSTKWVKRKYAFGAEGVPEGESDYLKVVYDFDQPMLPTGLSSPNIAHIFGTPTNPFELLVLKRNIMGPCWLRIEGAEQVTSELVSWCKAEFVVKDPKKVNPFADTDNTAPRDTPPLTLMSISVRTVINHEYNKREIVTASLRIWENTKIDDVTPPQDLPSSSHTFVRPIGNYPPHFETRARAQKGSRIVPTKSEGALLGQVLALMLKYDPDVLVGHDFISDDMEIILQRLKELKTAHWSRISRLRRSSAFPLGKQGTNIRLLTGRIVCDLTSDAAKGMISSTTWSLTEMCNSQLKITREEIEAEDVPDYLDSALPGPELMLRFVQHCEMDTFFQMAIAAKVQILPLTRQLTNLAGNSWGKTLTGGRSERNEYILLHEFHRLKYVCPDKGWGKQRDAAATAKAEAEELDPEGGVVVGKNGKGKSKEKYKGGLVFEPKRGLWDKYILVMDFNSLYPSIIQEYNIDFTTVDRVEDEDDIPEVPSADLDQGVLPRLIASLVNRRRQVKGLMKDRNATPSQLLQWNITQQALKLTANSMYGCLGFTQSRFYARPLAALTTHKGREILTHTRELAESMNLDVVYGDTDSVFVNSNVTDLAEALKTANQFKKLVNERYKLLEIDLDGVFRRLLLLQKKKYAAMKVDDGGKTSMEIKGLDMKRREFSPLAKNVSDYVLRQILSGEATEIAVEAIHEYLRTIGNDLREGKIPFEDFIINKRLGKDPEKYPDAKSQPHVQVALRMKVRGKAVHAGDVVPYIFCLGPNGESSKSGQADRAYHPDEIRKSKGKDKEEGSELKVDVEYYLATQVLPPIARLCEPMNELTDRARLADCLGLNPDQFATTTVGAPKERQLGVLDSQVPDSERFRDASPYSIRCPNPKCAVVTPFARLHDDSILTTSGPHCPSCTESLAFGALELQLDMQIKEHVGRYYEAWMVCDDPTCGMRTRRMSVVPRKCLRQGCFGNSSFEYTDAMLYTQLLYFASLFDEQRIIVSAESSARKDEIIRIMEANAPLLSLLAATVSKHMERCGRRYVNLSNLFSFMAL